MNSLRSHLFVIGCILVIWCSHAWAANLSFGEVQAGTIGSAAQSNSYTFSASANDVIDFTMVVTSGSLNPKLLLYNSAGTLLKSAASVNIYGHCGYSTLELNNVTLPASDSYTLIVGDCGDTNTGGYVIYAQRLNSPAGTVALSFGGQPQTGTIGSAAQSNSYTFRASANDTVNFTMAASGSLNPKLLLYNSAGTLLKSAASVNIYGHCGYSTLELNNVTLPASDSYTLIVGDCGDTNTGAYKLSSQCFGVCRPTQAGTESLPRSGVLSHIAAGGGWTTVITLINNSSKVVPVTVAFHNDEGSSWSLPVTATNQGATQQFTTPSVSAVINPDATLLISTGQLASTVVGWAEISSSGSVNGFAIFRGNSSNGAVSEGTVPLQTQFPSSIMLPYDNTAGFVMGAALANLSTASGNITATVWDDSGNQLGTQTLTIAGNGHTSFVLPNQIPLTAGKRGFVQLQSGASGGLAGLGLRFSPFGTFTSVPTI